MKFLKVLLLICWVIGISAIVGVMHSWHLIDLSPEKSMQLSISQYAKGVNKFGVIHYLSPQCSCSNTIVNHLLKRGPLNPEESKELVVLIDDFQNKTERLLKKRRFSVVSLNSKELSKESDGAIRGVPLLVIYDRNQVTKYVGGYSEKSITPFTQIDIKEYIKTLKEGRGIASKPVVGCAVSKEYKELLDPFGLKYTEKSDEHI
ncbi:putative membrane protein [Halobacteriovorax marinus SJ]|uniref:Membrane protein n=1 Tax=Halobacteriovorax marinus (strain ATCC BAA-682 / DSM 15412 / SJ) TaxID=862908 RepID=E1X105_HALMS|nr:hypothetical protein [Halobacteriovorax marinus]CBW28075.1 putative membrane protein [Halobacteriovorax marinus SJ]